MAKASSVRTAAHSFSQPGGITSPGGLVQRGGYAQERRIDIRSRPRITMPIKQSQVGGKEPKLPKGMA